ncbi:MAG TPA: peptidoglycan-binding protein [Acetobacteraceae bacterium]|nr:peptidoglycan-binding protein [Acetobacteraceae bacterium]
MTCVRASLVALGTALGSILLLTPPALPAASAREALVIGSGTYTALPPLPACLLSAHAVAAALRGLGFHVTEREDVSSGGADAAIGEFATQLATAPGAAAFVYSCGYATAFNDRPFLLPVSARITRPADVLTQGVLAKSLTDVLARGGTGPSVVAMDAVPMPEAPAALHLDALTQGSLPDGLGLVAASQAKPPDAPTPLAAALVANLKGPEVQVASLLDAVQQQVGANRSVTLSALRPPVVPGYLAGAPPPPPPPAQATAAPVAAATPPVSAPSAAMPADELMTDSDRQRAQTALARLGYYDGRIDGIFGPDSRAAIRRYQHELGADMSGRLTAAQAGRLVGGL